MKDKPKAFSPDLFEPQQGEVRDEVRIILAVLVGWLGVTFGFQCLLTLLGDAQGESLLTRINFFNLPFHFWFTGQFLPLWFVILCAAFNFYIDRLTERQNRMGKKFHD